MGGNHDLRLWEMGRNNPLLLFSPSVTVPKFKVPLGPEFSYSMFLHFRT